MKIYGLEKYRIEEKELKTKYSESIFDIRILINYFQDLDVLRPLTPKERRLLIRQKLRNDMKSLLKDYPNQNYQLTGTKIRPTGILGSLTGSQIIKLKSNSSIDQIIIIKAGRKKKEKERIVDQYYSVQGLFAVQVEGFDYSNKVRFTEERIILVKAVGSDEAIEKAKVEFKNYSDFEYLNSDYRLTRWEFVKIMDIYETDVSEIDNSGTEIFSVTRNRRIDK